jgi:hypothetical protein
MGVVAGAMTVPLTSPASASTGATLRGASVWRRYAYAWITAGFFFITIVGHWVFGWLAYVEEQREHGRPVSPSGYVVEMTRDTLENWQSEFLQLLWQVGGLALLLYVGSPQSAEGDQRLEEKIDALLRIASPQDAPRLIAEIDERFDRRDRHPE